MVRWKIILLAALLLPCLAQGQAKLGAIVEAERFHMPGKGERVDVNITILGATAHWATDERGFRQARVQALALVKDMKGGIVAFRKTMILSPERADTLKGDFFHQEHFILAPGSYGLTVELDDAVDPDTAKTYLHEPLAVPALPAGASLSDIQFMAHSAKEGNFPFAGTYFPPESKELDFYAEAYGTPKQFGAHGPFIAVAEIEDFRSKQVAGNFRHVLRLKADTVVPIGLGFGIEKLPSGNYLLAVELRDRNDSLVARREQFFQRNNPVSYGTDAVAGELGANFADAYTNPDTLAEYLSSMRPIADDMERKVIDDRWKDRKPDLMRSFMYTFWYNRSPQGPKAAWEKYRQAVIYANKQFGCRNMRGYQSDQGRIFLRYGAPNTVVDRSNETEVTPYMIWHYYRAGKYSDRRFVFYQPERSTTCWTLLTSDMPGEISNARWLDMIAPGMSDGGFMREEVQNNYDHPH